MGLRAVVFALVALLGGCPSDGRGPAADGGQADGGRADGMLDDAAAAGGTGGDAGPGGEGGGGAGGAPVVDAAVDAVVDAEVDMAPPVVDDDGDGIDDRRDNCVGRANPTQRDADGDGLGDACDVGDTDMDGLADRDDPCPLVVANEDTDGDGFGDACDVCPRDPDPRQLDADQDGVGDACEIPGDDDADGVPDRTDNCPRIPNGDQADREMDGVGDVCDICPDGADPMQLDTDGDGLVDGCDVCPEVSVVAENHIDRDGDGFPTCALDCDDSNAQRAEGLPERCDAIDNDCDLRIDEDFAGLGNACFAGEGVCRVAGTVLCQPGGMTTECSAQAGQPGGEVCDDLDNDCDGEVDEALVGCCDPGETRGCGSDVGQCTVGESLCLLDRTWSVCDGQGPVAEACDARDQDCDGISDEGLGVTPCGVGICQRDLPGCMNGQAPACDPLLGARVEACNGQDDDCDGQTDEAFDFETDARHCGRCDRACDPGVACEGGACGGLFTFEGIRENTPEADVQGWVCPSSSEVQPASRPSASPPAHTRT